MTKNKFEQANDKQKEYYIIVDGQKVPVDEETYRSYKRPMWKEKKRVQRQKAKATGGKDCAKAVGATPLSIDRMLEDGLDIPAEGSSPEDIYMRRVTIKAVRNALAQLDPDDRIILVLVGKGLSDRKISAKIGMPQTTVSYRRKILYKALREQLKDYR